MKKRLLMFVALILMSVGLAACGAKADYDAKSFRTALDAKQDVKDKTVRFKITKVVPNKKTGTSIYSDKNTAFIEKFGKSPKVKKGDTVTVKVKTAGNVLGDYIVIYTSLKK